LPVPVAEAVLLEALKRAKALVAVVGGKHLF